MLNSNIEGVMSLMKSGKLSPRDLVEACYKRAEIIKKLNAFITLLNKPNSVKAYPDGKLYGIPIAVKDNFCTSGVRTTCASRMLEDFVPTYSATVVERLKKAGAVIIGKCNMDEFAMGSGTVDSIYGPTKNIWRSDISYSVDGECASLPPDWRIAGGSSGGSAVAVATGACFAALGSDTGGSTRNPASHCGVVGFKPTYSTVSRHGLIPLCNSMDVPGILARTVDDTALVYRVISGRDPLDSTTVEIEDFNQPSFNLTKLRIGVPKEYHPPGLSGEVLKTWEIVSSIFEQNGASVKEVSLPHTPYSISCYSILNQAEVSSNMARYDGLRYGLRKSSGSSVDSLYAESRSNGLGQVVRARILAGNYFLLQRNYDKYFTKALKVRRLIAEDFKNVWKSVDVLLTPTTCTEAPRLSEFLNLDNREQCCREDYCTQPSNLAGCPAISLPVKLSSNGLPLSVQLIAPNFQDYFLLGVSSWLESQVRFPKLDIEDT